MSVQEKEALIAALKTIALGEQARTQGKGISAGESRAQLLAARQSRKQELWVQETVEAIEQSNAYVEKHGLPLEKYRMF